ncbi:MAG: chemotaxis protein CheB [Sulfurimonas sp.]|nr:chemotaxis protein CheB [Sulfurimonas sp.]
MVLTGASSGGPGQIQKIVSSLAKLTDTSVIIAQHMVEGFFPSFASTLQKNTVNTIEIIQNNQVLEASKIYLGEGLTCLDARQVRFIKKTASLNGYNPDINTLFKAFVSFDKECKILCVILTGIGSDGVDACKALASNGAICITESKSSAIVDGMPKRARALVPNIKVHEMDEIIQAINEFCDV